MQSFLTKEVSVDEGRMLVEFISTFGASLDLRLWMDLVKEEAGEVIQAFASETDEQKLKELADLRYVIVGNALIRSPHYLHLMSEEDYESMASLDGASQLVMDALESSEVQFTEEQLDEAFRRVHASNMSKLDDEGKPIRRDDGKIMKGPNYQKPDLSDLVEQQEAA